MKRRGLPFPHRTIAELDETTALEQSERAGTIKPFEMRRLRELLQKAYSGDELVPYGAAAMTRVSAYLRRAHEIARLQTQMQIITGRTPWWHKAVVFIELRIRGRKNRWS